ncbi:hypothetical protein Q6D67_10595 [Haliea sp. E1-2-M8]|uniref:hypothetical protein n=1 Tax=Haliea sp. E1-2-M8 TaxID=3064706 RepID=UPI00271E8650|nr:hypothetical protein [Haliea sp. E1-2-M8]MDO8862151.1 hypothetical protein [Haliea sp. E1-2-M8]
MKSITYSPSSIEKLKSSAKKLRNNRDMPYAEALDFVASVEGFKSWSHLMASNSIVDSSATNARIANYALSGPSQTPVIPDQLSNSPMLKKILSLVEKNRGDRSEKSPESRISGLELAQKIEEHLEENAIYAAEYSKITEDFDVDVEEVAKLESASKLFNSEEWINNPSAVPESGRHFITDEQTTHNNYQEILVAVIAQDLEDSLKTIGNTSPS